jgi:hypothetical protein
MRTLIVIAVISSLAACTAQQNTAALQTPAGQLFCAIQTAGGGAVVVGLVNAEIAAVPGAAPTVPLAVIATGMTKTLVDANCAAAGGIAVAPPANPAAAPQVAVVAPKVS